jgi:hypothetical protein
MSKSFKVELGEGKKLETFSVHSACDMIDSEELILNPEYQTGSRWKGLQQSKLIDSLVNGLDLPKLYFRTVRKGADDIYEVVDGQQRLRAISEFRKDGFKLKTGEFKGKVFSKLPHQVRRRINDFDLHVMILSGERWSDEVIRDLFLRLQMGTPLNPAEKRRALPGNFPIIVAKLANHKLFGSNSSITENRYGYEDAVAKILHLVYSPNRPMIADAAIRKTYLANKEVTETSQQVQEVKKTLDYLSKSLKDSGEYFKKFNILSVVTSLVAIMEHYSLSGQHKAVGDLLWEIEKKRKKNDELKPGDPSRNPILTKLSETARSDRTDHLEWRKDFYSAQFIQLGLTPLDPRRRFSNLERGILVRLQEGHCKKCNCKITAETGQVDHVKPYSKGGLTILENAQLLCESCNKSKGARE